MGVNLKSEDSLHEGAVIQFYAYYTEIPFFGPSKEQIAAALASAAEITVTGITSDVVNKIASPTQHEWSITATYHGIPWSVGQLQGDICNALSAMLGDSFGASKAVTVGPFVELAGAIVDANPDPAGNQGDTEPWYCTYLGLGCSAGAGSFNWSTSVGLIAIALIVISVVYFVKGVRVNG